MLRPPGRGGNCGGSGSVQKKVRKSMRKRRQDLRASLQMEPVVEALPAADLQQYLRLKIKLGGTKRASSISTLYIAHVCDSFSEFGFRAERALT
jgi:hypothetical protein